MTEAGGAHVGTPAPLGAAVTLQVPSGWQVVLKPGPAKPERVLQVALHVLPADKRSVVRLHASSLDTAAMQQ
jgi:hypothetical protein